MYSLSAVFIEEKREEAKKSLLIFKLSFWSNCYADNLHYHSKVMTDKIKKKCLMLTKAASFYESDVTYDQVWWPILGICALHLSHPKCTHTQQWTHTPWTHTSSGQPFMLRHLGSSWGFGALLKDTSVVVLKVERALYIHSPLLQFLPARDSNPRPLDYESNSLTIRPRLPPLYTVNYLINIIINI